jgi:cytoskeletal protein RodZ
MSAKKTGTKSRFRLLISGKGRFALLALLIIVLVGLFLWQHDGSSISTNGSTSASADKGTTRDGVNYSPPTNSDKNLNDQHKDELVKESQSSSQQKTSAGTPVITAYGYQAGSLQIGAYVPNIIEDGGTCTLTAVNGSETVKDTSVGVKNASNTVCSFSTPRSKFPSSGTWSVSISYSSTNSSTGSSTSVKVAISP